MRKSLLAVQFAALVCLALPASAQEPAVPAPDRLSADWWSYFSPVEELAADALDLRINQSRDLLDRALMSYQGADREELTVVANRLFAGLERYAQHRKGDTPTAAIIAPVSATYSLDAALERYRTWHRLDIDVRANSKEAEWQQSLLEVARRQQNQRRTAYLEIKATDAKRFAMGIHLMAARAELEVRAADLDQQKRQVEETQSELNGLVAELALIPKRLQPEPSSLESWRAELAKAEAGLLERQQQVSTAPSLESSAVPDIGQGAIMARRDILSQTVQEMQLSTAEVEVQRAALGLSLEEFLAGNSGKTNWDKLESQLENHKKFSSGFDQMQIQFQGTIERIRMVAGEQLAAADSNDPLNALRQGTLALADSASQSLRQLETSKNETAFIAELLEVRLNEAEGWLNRASNQTKRFTGRIWESVTGMLRYTLFEINETPVNLLGILRVLLIFTVAWWASRFLQRGVQRFGEKKVVSETALYTVERLIHYVILAVGVMVGLSSIGLDLTKFALFASALGVGLGFGLQAVVGNFVAGLIVLFEKSINVGNFVELESGVTGEVKEINMRSTLIRTNDNVDILVPNSEFVSGRVTNWTLRESVRRIHISFGVAYGSDKDLVKKAALEAAERVPSTYRASTKREPAVWLVGFGDSSLDFELVVWLTPEAVKRPGAVHADFLWEIETSLAQHGIEIPFPQRDIHLRTSNIDLLKGSPEHDG